VTGDGGVGVDGGGHHASEASSDQGLGARSGAACVVARFKGDVSGAAAQFFASELGGNRESNDLRVVLERVLVPAFAANLARAVQNYAANGGVG